MPNVEKDRIWFVKTFLWLMTVKGPFMIFWGVFKKINVIKTNKDGIPKFLKISMENVYFCKFMSSEGFELPWQPNKMKWRAGVEGIKTYCLSKLLLFMLIDFVRWRQWRPKFDPFFDVFKCKTEVLSLVFFCIMS